MGRWKKQSKIPLASETEVWDPFAAVPMIAEGVEVREDSQGMVQLRGTPPQRSGFAASLSRRLGFQRYIRANLDANGSLFWKQIDGQRSLREIEGIVRRETQQDQETTEKAVILFTKMLMQRHLICLALPADRKHSE